MKGCLIDLLGALIAGSKSQQFQVGLRLAESLYGLSDKFSRITGPSVSHEGQAKFLNLVTGD